MRIIRITLYLFLLPAFLLAQPKMTDIRSAVQSILDSVIIEQDIPGATAAVILPSGELLGFASGKADKEAGTAMPVGARMLLGSTGKVFVSAVFLQLVEEGKVKLDDKVADYFKDTPWFSRIPNAADLTIRSLLNHTSGIPRYVFNPKFLEAVKANPLRTWTPQECLAMIFDAEPAHAVGQGWGYSDTNYIILGMLIEKLTGDTFYNQLQRRILDPLKLTNTFPSNRRDLAGLCQGYIGEHNFFELPVKVVTEDGLYVMNPQFEWTGGGLMTNVDDLATVLRALHKGELLKPETYQELIQAVALRTGQPSKTGYSLGSFVWNSPVGISYGHAGIMPGYLTHIEFFKDYDISIAYQMNTDQGGLPQNHATLVRIANRVAGLWGSK